MVRNNSPGAVLPLLPLHPTAAAAAACAERALPLRLPYALF